MNACKNAFNHVLHSLNTVKVLLSFVREFASDTVYCKLLYILAIYFYPVLNTGRSVVYPFSSQILKVIDPIGSILFNIHFIKDIGIFPNEEVFVSFT